MADDEPHSRDVTGDEPTAEQRRLSFGETAELYDRYRPTYAEAALRWALGDRPRHVLDLGAGTGLLAEVVLGLGHRVTAVEPDEGMRRQLARRLAGRGRVLGGTAEAIPLPAASVDAVVVGQAFHWFDLDVALPEMARVLADGGTLAVAWNVRNDDVDWVEQLSAVVGRLDARSGSRDEVPPDLGTSFRRPERAQFPHVQLLGVDELVGLVGTYSYVRLSPRRAAVLAEVRDIGRRHVEPAADGRIALPYDTVVYRADRRPRTA